MKTVQQILTAHETIKTTDWSLCSPAELQIIDVIANYLLALRDTINDAPTQEEMESQLYQALGCCKFTELTNQQSSRGVGSSMMAQITLWVLDRPSTFDRFITGLKAKEL